MIVTEVIFALAFLMLCGIATKTDLQSGVILNKSLIPFAVSAIALNGVYYGLFARDIIVDFIVNVLIIAIIGIFLFYTHSFAGGDCKLCIVLAMLYPGRFYITVSGSIYTLYIAIGLAIFYGYVYLLVASIWKVITGKKKIQLSYLKNYIMGFIKSFVVVTIYISGITLLTVLAEKFGIAINTWISRIVCLSIAWLIGKNRWMKKPVLVGGILLVDLVLVFFTGVIPISINPSNYLLAIILLLCQMTISTDLYDEVAIADLKKGMILSTISSVMMQGSRVRGLPEVSSEDLRNRLTEVEVDSVKRWAKYRKIETITIVRKIPFAIFLVMGYLTYFIVWSVYR